MLNTSTLRRSEGGSIQHLQPEMKMLDCERYTRFGSCWFQRKMVFRGGVRPPPRSLSASPARGGGQPCTGLCVSVPPVRKSPVSRLASDGLAHTAHCRVNGGQVGWGVSKPVHGSVHPYDWADVCGMLARTSAQNAMCCCDAVGWLDVCCSMLCTFACGRISACSACEPRQKSCADCWRAPPAS